MFTTAQKIAYGNAMAAMCESGWRVNTTEYDGPVVEVSDNYGEYRAIGSLPGWDHSDPDRLAFLSADDAENYMRAVFMEIWIPGSMARFERKFLASRGLDQYGRALAA